MSQDVTPRDHHGLEPAFRAALKRYPPETVVGHRNETLHWFGRVAPDPEDPDRLHVKISHREEVLVYVVWTETGDGEGLLTGWMLLDGIYPVDPASAARGVPPTGQTVTGSDACPTTEVIA